MMQGVAPHIQQYLQKITTSNPSILPNKVQVWLIQAYLIGQNHQRDTVHQCQYQNFGCILGPNDPWDMPDLVNGGQLKFQTPEWEMGYRQRMMDILDSAKITIRKSFGSHRQI